MSIVAVGLDLSLTETGYATIEHTPAMGPVVVNGGTVKPTPRKLREAARLAFWRGFAIETIRCAAEISPPIIAIERYVNYGRHGNTAQKLAEQAGIFKEAIFDLGADYFLVGPRQLKEWATGSGKAEKAEMVQAVRDWHPCRSQLRDTEIKHDYADALWLADIAQAFQDPTHDRHDQARSTFETDRERNPA